METEYGGERLEQGAAERLRLLELIAKNANDAILVTEAEPVDQPGPRIVYVNESFTRMTGYAPEEVFGKTPRILQSAGTDRAELDRLRVALERWKPVRVELLNVRKDGTEFWVELNIMPAANEKGWYTHWVSIQRETTGRRMEEEKRRREEERHRAALAQYASDVVAIFEADGTVRYASPSVESVLGFRPEELAGTNFSSYVHPEDLGAVQRTFAEAAEGAGVTRPVELRVRCSDGSYCYLEAVSNNLLADPGVKGIVVNAWDITVRKKAEDELYLKDRAIAASSNGIIITDPNLPDNPIIYVNPKFEEITGYEAGEAIGLNCRFLAHGDKNQPAVNELRIAIAEGREWSGPLRNYRRDGTLFWNELYIAPVHGKDGRIANFIGVQKDITERKLLEERLVHQAFHDALTDLPNRALFLDRLGHALTRARRREDAVAVLFMDLDNFKVINDSLGHPAGDRLLLAVSERLSTCLRPADTAARLGGDEFTILLEDVSDPGEAEKVAERITEVLREPFHLDATGQELFITTSVGIAFGGTAGEQPEELLRNADLAMYKAKGKGKNYYEVFETGMDARALERLETENALRRALQREEFRIHYQPEVSLGTGGIVGVEALLRWDRPERGIVPPADFIPLAEETGLIVPIGRWVLREACRQMREWQERFPAAPPPTVSVNLSAKQFRQPDLAGDVAQTLRETGLGARSLILEITESVMMDDARSTIATLQKLKQLGVGIAVDDFGTGYSSLSYLKRFPVDFLKIDRSFVDGLGYDTEDRGLVSATIGLAHTLGLETIAEGVETEGQLAHLRKLDCSLAQGYYFQKPAPAGEISEVLRASIASRGERQRER